ncbi:Serine/threonine-protein kinase PrkC [Actinomyces bovis]|uniref:Serine/threonine-protein kinase PrkC n=1 Tax=Actinomyces bovis TaxID=1658 RepID=A0ABY1VPX3_9ACTO|nr:hypothetical protein [Actinomyces bovis]SPT54115.1 Serine/threonine-protein kinase PrkC [Actinomyces bovis]VEG53644.1 Serine/threonine-protein kinase PrkC [Actinomyces israelii]
MNKGTAAGIASLTLEQEAALEELGYVISEPAGVEEHSPLRALAPDGESVLLRLVQLPKGADRVALLRRLAELRRLRHPGLARLLNLHELPGGAVAVCWQQVEGVDLAILLGARGRLRRDEAAQLLVDLGTALAHLHEQGLAHGDVSAANTVITPQGHAVLIDLLGEPQETGTAPFAAPERSAGVAPTAASDVRALAALVEQAVAAQRTALGHLVLLEDALSDDPAERPTARALAERAPRLAAPVPIELPEEAGLAAGLLRACVQSPTRRRAGRRWRPRFRKGTPRLAVGPGNRRPAEAGPKAQQKAWARGTAEGPPGRRRRGAHCAKVRQHGRAKGMRTAFAVFALVLAIGGAQWLRWPLGQPSGELAAAAPAVAELSAPAPASTTASTAEAVASELISVVLGLVRVRDAAVESGDAAALAATSVAGSPAAQSDEALLRQLQESGETVSGLRTELQNVSEVPLTGLTLSTVPPDGARAVRATLRQPACTRSGADGSRVVPARPARKVVLVLVPGPWRVQEVLAGE